MACDSPIFVKKSVSFTGHNTGNDLKREVDIRISCGKCPGCKLRRIQEWVHRLQEEDKVSRSAYFVTLSYAPHSVPISNKGFMTLSKTRFEGKKQIDSDLQRFFKALRKREPLQIRYYACGEYGDTRMRPHYHLILFNVSDAVHIGYDNKGNKLFRSENVLRSWMRDNTLIGDVYMGQVTNDSIAYTAKYIDKEKKIPIHKNDDRVKEFSLMSKNLGRTFIQDYDEDNKVWIPKSKINDYFKQHLGENFVHINGNKVPLARYYRNKIFSEHEKQLSAQITATNILFNEEKEEAKFLNKGKDYSIFKALQRHYRYRKFYSNSKNRSYD